MQAPCPQTEPHQVRMSPFPLTYILPTPVAPNPERLGKDAWAQVKDLVTSNSANLDFYLLGAMTSWQVHHMSKRCKGSFLRSR